MKPSKAEIIKAVERFGALAMFPNASGAQEEIMRLLERMVGTMVQLEWLVRTMIDKVGQWHGPAELRGVFCSRFKPADGIEAYCVMSAGFTPSDIETRGLELPAGDYVALPPGHSETADPELESAVHNLARRKRLQ